MCARTTPPHAAARIHLTRGRTMPKQKFNNFDVCAEAAALRRRCVGMRLNNVYDVDDKASGRTLLLKFTRSGGATASGEADKVTVLVESGTRFHTTAYALENKRPGMPSKFNEKLRMHLRSKRLSAVTQFGMDRAVDFTFGSGDTEHHLILELYAQGNVVLTDKDYRILTLLRPHRDDDKGVVLLGNHPYPRERFRAFRRLAREEMDEALLGSRPGAAAAAGDVEDATRGAEDPPRPGAALEPPSTKTPGESRSRGGGGGDDERRRPVTVREALCRALGHGPPVIDHAARAAGLPMGGATRLPLPDDAAVDALYRQLSALDDWFENVAADAVEPEGVIVTRRASAGGAETEDDVIYDDFSPFVLAQHENTTGDGAGAPGGTTSFKRVEGGFDAALDEYFATAARQAERLARERAEKTAANRLDKVRRDQDARAAALEREKARDEARATLIEYNIDEVDTVLNAVNSALGSGMAWGDLEQMIKEERRMGNPVAQLIASMDLANNKVTVALANRLDGDAEAGEAEEEAEEGGEDGDAGGKGEKGGVPRGKKKRSKTTAVELDLGMSAYANARAHFEQKKKHAAKHDKTLAQHQRAVAAAEKKAQEAIAHHVARGPGGISKARASEWFEKFHWFVTTENCLVLSARDASQADILVRRYMNVERDAFVHADVPGAPVTVVKAPPVRDGTNDVDTDGVRDVDTSSRRGRRGGGWCNDVPPLSLAQAGAACLCRSSAWDSRHVISAWWARPEDTRKVTPEGDPLAQGVVWTVGRRHFLPPAPLIMGFGFIFLLGDGESVAAHADDRVVKATYDDDDDGEDGEDAEEGEDDASGDGGNRARREVEAGSCSDEATNEGVDVGNRSSALDAFLDGGVDLPSRGHRGATAETNDDDASDDGREAARDGDGGASGGSKRLSAKERRMLKKQRRGGACIGGANDGGDDLGSNPGGGGGDGDDDDVDEPPRRPMPRAQQPQPQPVKKPLPRGKSAKAKRAAAKYADQDEEDRELAVALMAAAGKKNKKGKGKGKGKGRDDDSDEDDVIDPVAAKMQRVQLRERPHAESPAHATGQNPPPPKEKHGDARAGGRAEAERADGVGDVEADPAASAAAFAAADAARVARVDWFTGSPLQSDAVEYAIPVVAPYTTLQSYRYKVKLTPGSQKKGKAAKQAFDVITRASALLGGGGGADAREREAEKREKAFDAAMKAMMRAAEGAPGDLARVMCGNGVKVSMPAGAVKAINASRKKAGR